MQCSSVGYRRGSWCGDGVQRCSTVQYQVHEGEEVWRMSVKGSGSTAGLGREEVWQESVKGLWPRCWVQEGE